jgi:hypothetical protein
MALTAGSADDLHAVNFAMNELDGGNRKAILARDEEFWVQQLASKGWLLALAV